MEFSMSWFTNLFSGGIVKSIENIALELIETDKESAEAKVVLIKALDPNGKMRRDISGMVSKLYCLYIVVALILLLVTSFGIVDVDGSKVALEGIVELFVPITAMFTAIVSASFGVNVSNNFKKKDI